MRRWASSFVSHAEDYTLWIPEHLAAGCYELRLRLRATKEDRTVFIALDRSLVDEEGYCTITMLDVEQNL